MGKNPDSKMERQPVINKKSSLKSAKNKFRHRKQGTDRFENESKNHDNRDFGQSTVIYHMGNAQNLGTNPRKTFNKLEKLTCLIPEERSE